MSSLKIHKSIKSVIFLKTTEKGSLASLFIIDAENKSRLQGRKLLSRDQALELCAKKDALAEQSIFIFEELETVPVMFLEAELPNLQYSKLEALIPSPYVSNLFREAEFFSTQKTRGPNK